jgi:hypothetical protein
LRYATKGSVGDTGEPHENQAVFEEQRLRKNADSLPTFIIAAKPITEQTMPKPLKTKNSTGTATLSATSAGCPKFRQLFETWDFTIVGSAVFTTKETS